MTMLMIFIPIFLLQTILAIIVLFILKKILDYQLLELGITRMENFGVEEEKKAKDYHVTITSCRPLNSEKKQRILRGALKNLGTQAKVDFQISKKMLGGMTIQINDDVYSYSLRERLKDSGIIKFKN